MASNGSQSPIKAKRTRAEMETSTPNPTTANPDDSDTSSDDDFGPALPSSAPKRKKRRLPHESLYVAALPSARRYAKSLMHRDQLAFTTITPHTDFLITTSVDGIVKFWKKERGGVEFVKEFKAHEGEVIGVAVSVDGRSFASAGRDGTVKVWDVESFDLLVVLRLGYIPGAVCWVHGRGASLPVLAVGDAESACIRLYDGRGEREEPISTVKGVHRVPIHLMAYNPVYDCVISADTGGMVEYWRPSGSFEKPEGLWGLKSATSLFEFKKSKCVPSSVVVSPNGKLFATFSFPDRRVRVFDFVTGKLQRSYDESLDTLTAMQQAGTAVQKLEDMEFGRRMGLERELEALGTRSKLNILFDETSNFILYGTMYGVKTINTVTNKMVRLYGADEGLRPLHIALYQGQPDKKSVTTVEMAASDNPLLAEAEARDAMLVTTALNKVRFFMFTHDDTAPKTSRDINNEKPRTTTSLTKSADTGFQTLTDTTATLHTTLGDIALRLFPALAPKAVQNFTTHARNGYFNNLLFHRVIRKFMIQTGDPLGDGTGGESIWGKDFEDEFGDAGGGGSGGGFEKAYALAMANAGPGTNASQFFITTEKTPWLTGKHTIFGRAVGGLDTVHKIENVKCHKERPMDEVKIVSISIS